MFVERGCFAMLVGVFQRWILVWARLTCVGYSRLWALVGVFLFLVLLVVGGESGDELESFEAFGEWCVDVFAVFGSPSSHPFVDIFGFVELADVGFDGADRLFDVLFFEGVPVAASFAEHHDPDFVDFPGV